MRNNNLVNGDPVEILERALEQLNTRVGAMPEDTERLFSSGYKRGRKEGVEAIREALATLEAEGGGN